MKVVQINAVNKISSTGRSTWEMNEYFKSIGQDCISAYSKGVVVDPEREYRIGNDPDTKLHGLFSRIFGLQGYFSRRATKKLVKYIDGLDPDVVVLRNLHGNYINLKIITKYLAKKQIATVAVLHDCWFFTGKCCHYTKDGCYRWREACGHCPSLKKYNKSWFFDRSRKMLRDKTEWFSALDKLGVVGVSEWITNEARSSVVFRNAKEFAAIYNWVDLNKFKPADTSELRSRMGLEGKKVILCVASRWDSTKGLGTVIDISKKLSDNEIILMVGKVDDGRIPKDKIISVKATDSIEELAAYYSTADVFLQPSLEETFGKVSAEALACGTPVVCFRSTANPELVGEGCGLVASDLTADAMLDAIRQVSSREKSLYQEVCRGFAMKNFDKNTNLEKYLRFFETLL